MQEKIRRVAEMERMRAEICYLIKNAGLLRKENELLKKELSKDKEYWSVETLLLKKYIYGHKESREAAKEVKSFIWGSLERVMYVKFPTSPIGTMIKALIEAA